MFTKLNKRENQLKILISLGISIFVSLMVACFQEKIGLMLFGITTVSFIIYAMVLTLKITSFNFNSFENHNMEKATEEFHKKKYFQSSIYFLVTPMLIVGVLFGIIQMIIFIKVIFTL